MLNEYISLDNQRIAYRIIDGEVVLIDLKDNTLNILNPVGSYILENLDRPIQVKDIVKIVSNEFDVDYKTAENDCLLFISDLIKRNIVILKSNFEEF